MFSNMVTSLFDKERITTTAPKAKEARRSAERLVTRAKKGYVAYQEFQSLKESGSETEAKQKQAEALSHWRSSALAPERSTSSRSIVSATSSKDPRRSAALRRPRQASSSSGCSSSASLKTY